jgi:hypothetical protein
MIEPFCLEVPFIPGDCDIFQFHPIPAVCALRVLIGDWGRGGEIPSDAASKNDLSDPTELVELLHNRVAFNVVYSCKRSSYLAIISLFYPVVSRNFFFFPKVLFKLGRDIAETR